MQKSESVIRYDFAKSRCCADRLEWIAGNMRSTADAGLGSALSGIHSAWDSESSAVFLNKGRQLQAQFMEQSRELQKTADVIRRIAKNTYTAEMRARDIAAKGSRG